VAGVNGKTVASPAAPAAAKKGAWHRATETAAGKLNQATDVDDAAEAHASAEKAAQGLVSNALILPILKQVRRSSFGENSVFSGGNGEKAFGPEFDMQLADRIAQSPRLGVREALVQRLERRSPVAGNQTPASNGLKVASRIDVNG
jgi:Rod binding domain-containing protein